MALPLATALLLWSQAAAAEASFFPPGSLSRDPDEHGSRSVWFTSVLRGLDERPLRAGAAEEVYRLVKMPAFGDTEVVRVERTAGAAVLTWKRRPPDERAGEKGPGAPGNRGGDGGQRKLDDLEWKELVDRVAAAQLASLTPDASEIGLDGVTYLLEARWKGGYRALFRWSPTGGTLCRLFDGLLALTRSASPPPIVDPRAGKVGRVVGRITGGSRALANVTAILEGGGVVEDRASDRAGRFAIEGLVPGLYAFRVERPGFPIMRSERGPYSLLWDWDQVVEVRPGDTTCVDIRYDRSTPEPRLQLGCPKR